MFRRRRLKQIPGVIMIDLRPVVDAFNNIYRMVQKAYRSLQPPLPTPHCGEHAKHEMSCHRCVNALAGLTRGDDVDNFFNEYQARAIGISKEE